MFRFIIWGQISGLFTYEEIKVELYLESIDADYNEWILYDGSN